MTVGLHHVRWVVAAAQHRSFRGAAATLRVRQSTLSRTIRQVEERLGVNLFTRSSSGIRLTPAGIDLVSAAELLLDQFDALISRGKALGLGKAGTLTLGFVSASSMTPLWPVLFDYASRCPEVEIRPVSKPRQRLLLDLEAGRVDLAVITGDVSQQGCESLALWSERILITLPRTHPLSERACVHWTDVKDETFLLSGLGAGPDLKNRLLTRLSAIGIQPRLDEHDIDTKSLSFLVAARRGLTLECEATAAAAPGLVHREVQDSSGPSELTYSACWNKENANPALGSLLALLRAHRCVPPPRRSASGEKFPRPATRARRPTKQ
jgi:DNA-binding transcriptional LysR family regulator